MQKLTFQRNKYGKEILIDTVHTSEFAVDKMEVLPNFYTLAFLRNSTISVDQNDNIRFYLPFDNFKTMLAFTDVDEYLVYKKKVLDFINARNKRIENYANKRTSE